MIVNDINQLTNNIKKGVPFYHNLCSPPEGYDESVLPKDYVVLKEDSEVIPEAELTEETYEEALSLYERESLHNLRKNSFLNITKPKYTYTSNNFIYLFGTQMGKNSDYLDSKIVNYDNTELEELYHSPLGTNTFEKDTYSIPLFNKDGLPIDFYRVLITINEAISSIKEVISYSAGIEMILFGDSFLRRPDLLEHIVRICFVDRTSDIRLVPSVKITKKVFNLKRL